MLSNNDMKRILGGNASEEGSCCTHDNGWFYWNCTYNSAEDASSHAEEGGGMWCCDSCQESWNSSNPNCPYLTVC